MSSSEEQTLSACPVMLSCGIGSYDSLTPLPVLGNVLQVLPHVSNISWFVRVGCIWPFCIPQCHLRQMQWYEHVAWPAPYR